LEVDVPSTRTRRKRQTRLKPIAQRLLGGEPIEQTESNGQELIGLKYFGWRDYAPDYELGKRLERLAHDELERWREGSL
jgi:hypothetical protein